MASLDVLSGGRVELGLGAGYQRAEFGALGVDFEERNELFDEALGVLAQVWTGEPVTLDGLHFKAKAVAAVPRPAQLPHPPIWFGGNSMLTRRRVLEHGAGWLPLPNARASAHVLRSPALETVQDLAELLDDLRARAAASGRPGPDRVMYFLPDLDQTDLGEHVDLGQQVADLGVDWLFVNGQGKTEKEATEWIARYQEAVLGPLNA